MDTLHLNYITDTTTTLFSHTFNFCDQEQAVLEVSSSLPNIEWSTGETSPIITVFESGTYFVTASQGQCVINREYTIKPCEYKIHLPNAFTANGDGLNDYHCDGYLEGVEVVSMDYRRLFSLYQLVPDVIFILDPPYLSTDCGTYKSDNYWKLSDYLDVLKCLKNTKFVYFTSDKSTIVEFADWIARNDFRGNPFEGAKVYRQHVSGIALNYDDTMLVKVT